MELALAHTRLTLSLLLQCRQASWRSPCRPSLIKPSVPSLPKSLHQGLAPCCDTACPSVAALSHPGGESCPRIHWKRPATACSSINVIAGQLVSQVGVFSWMEWFSRGEAMGPSVHRDCFCYGLDEMAGYPTCNYFGKERQLATSCRSSEPETDWLRRTGHQFAPWGGIPRTASLADHPGSNESDEICMQIHRKVRMTVFPMPEHAADLQITVTNSDQHDLYVGVYRRTSRGALEG